MTSSEIASGDNSERDDDAGPPRLAGLPEYILAAIVGFAADLPTRLLRRGVSGADGARSEGGKRILLDNSRVYVRFLPFVRGRGHLGRLSKY